MAAEAVSYILNYGPVHSNRLDPRSPFYHLDFARALAGAECPDDPPFLNGSGMQIAIVREPDGALRTLGTVPLDL